MTYALDKEKLSQQQIFFVILTLPVCSLVYSQGDCSASGGQCSNTISTTERPNDFTLTTRDFYFCSRGVLLYKGLEVWPFIRDVSGIVTRLDPQQKESTVVNARYSIFMDDCSNPPPFFHDKGAGFFHDNRNGTFLRKLKSISGAYKNSRIRIYESLSTDPRADHVLASGLPDVSNMKLKFDGKLKNIIENDGIFQFDSTHDTDVFKEVQVPAPISSNNVIQDTVIPSGTPDFSSTDTEISVFDTTEYRRTKYNLFAINDDTTDTVFHFINTADKADVLRQFDFTTTPVSMTMDRRKDILYVLDSTGDLFKLDLITLTKTQVDGDFSTITAIAMNSNDDKLLGTDGDTLFELNFVINAILSIGTHSDANTVRDLVFDHRNGILYGTRDSGAGATSLVTINTSTGAIASTIKVIMLSGTNDTSLAFDTEEDALFAVHTDTSPTADVYSIDVATGDATLIFALTDSTFLDYISAEFIPAGMAHVKIVDSSAGDEYLKVNYFDDSVNKIHVFRDDLFGTSAVGHFAGPLVKQVSVYLNRDDTGLDADKGLPVVDAFFRLIMGEVKIPLDRYDLAELQVQAERWMRNFPVRRIIEDGKSSEVLIRELSTVTNSNTFMDEGAKIKTKAMAPDDPTVTVKTLNQTENFLGPVRVNDNKEEEAPVTICHHKPITSDIFGNKSSRNQADYINLAVSLDQFISGPNFLNTKTPKRYFSPWLFRQKEAGLFTDRHRKRWEIAPKLLKGLVARKDSDTDVGALVDVTIDELEDQLGIPEETNAQVIFKEEMKGGSVQIEMLETKIVNPIGFIAPSIYVGILFDAGTDLQKKYAHMGTGINPITPGGTDWRNATLGAAEVDGRYFF